MSDLSGGAVAPADAPPIPDAGAPIGEAALPPQPLGSQIPPDARADAQPAKAPSLDDSIDRAIAKHTTKEAAEKATPEKVAKDQPEKEPPARAENGKFASKEPAQQPAKPAVEAKAAEPVKPSFTASEAPARFSPDAKAKWAETDESVRGETERAIRELTEGHTKYKAAAERDSTLNEYHEMAKQSGKDLRTVVGEYVNMEQTLRKDLVGGLDTICQRLGVSLKDVAAHVLNQPADQQASQHDATIRELKAEIADLKSSVGNVTQTFQQQQTMAVGKEVQDFAAAHPRFDELSEDIAFFLQHKTKDLAEAYSLAERLNPAPAAAATAPAAASSAVIDLPAQPDKGQKSIHGAPSSGSIPVAKKRVALSLDESLDRAFGRTG
jgi:hypothetical protein